MKLRATCLIALGGLLTACSSGPEPLPPRRQPPPAPRRVAAVPQGTVIPLDAWRRDLDQYLPAPWTFHHVDAQVSAPPGWTKIAGDRGVALWLSDGAVFHSYYVMPVGFEGQVVDASVAAQERTRDERFVLFEPPSAPEGWSGTDEVVAALGIGVSPEEAGRQRAKAEVRYTFRRLSDALEAFRADVGRHPKRLEDLWAAPAGAKERWKGPYLESEEARDPWEGELAYSASGSGFTLVSYGADGLPGGEGDDADLEFEGGTLQK